MKAKLSCAFLCAALLCAACSSSRRSEPIEGAFKPSSGSVQRGQQVFLGFCSKCHPGGEGGLGPSLNDKPLPVFLMKLQVRKGLGAMPSFSEKQIPDQQLDDLMAFIVAYRHHG